MTSETRFTRRCFRASKRGQRAQTRDCLLPQPGTTRVTLCRSSRVFLGVPLTLSLSVRCKALPSLSLRSLQLRGRLLLLGGWWGGWGLRSGDADAARGGGRLGEFLGARHEAGVHGPTIDAGAFTV